MNTKYSQFLLLVNNHLFTIGVGVLISVIWARMFEVEQYGSYKLATSFFAITNFVCLAGFTESVKISASKKEHGNLKILVVLKFTALLLGAIATYLVGVYKYSADPHIIGAILGMSLIFPLYQWIEFWKSWELGMGHFKSMTQKNIVYQGLILICLLLSALADVINMTILIVLVLGVPSLSNIVYVFKMLKSVENNIINKQTIKHGIKMTFLQLLQVFMIVDVIIIERYLSIEAVALFSVAMIFPRQVSSLRKILAQYYTPEVYSADSVVEGWRVIKPKFLKLCTIFLAIGLIGFLFIPIIVPILFSQKYIMAIHIAKYMWLVTCVVSPLALLSTILISQKKVKAIFLILNVHPVVYSILLIVSLMNYATLETLLIVKVSSSILLALFYVLPFIYYVHREGRFEIS